MAVPSGAVSEGSGAETDVDEKLLALKRDMGLIGPASSVEEPRALGAGEVEVADAEILDEDDSESDDAVVDEVDEPKE